MGEAGVKIYVASSWKNGEYFELLRTLRGKGYEPLDWREKGFGWNQVTGTPAGEMTPQQYRDEVLTHPRACEGFANDHDKMMDADACILLLPCGRSAHLEAGWFWGQGKPLHIFIPVFDTPELMYKGATSISFTVHELLGALKAQSVQAA
jgi:hypothetical protein